MAEFVQQHMESMTGEIEEMRRAKMYTTEELGFIVKTRNEFEYKINGVSKNLKDFKEYIMYEKVLLKQINNRRNKYMIGDRKNGIEFKILVRIKNLYEKALQRFSNDLSLYLSYFKFCKQSNFTRGASRAIDNMIKNCYQNPEVWQVASIWHAHDRNDLNTALIVLNKGLTIHKNSKLLYTEAIKLELSVIKNSSLSEDNDLISKVCKRIETYVNFICDCIKDCNYLIETIDLLESYSFTISVQHLIIDNLVSQYSDKEFVWHTLAQRERRGLHYATSNDPLLDSDQNELIFCFAKYQEGLSKVSQSEKGNLWLKYLDCLVEALRDNNESTKIQTISLLKNALEKASDEKFLTENYYIKWLEFSTDEEALNILNKGTSILPQSIDLWKLHLRYAVMTNKNIKVDEIFKRGIKMLKERSLPLWFMYLRYYGLLSRDDIISNIYNEAIRQPQEISGVLKPKYIEWLALTKGITIAREMYNKLAKEKPYCKELHSTMSKLESTEIDPNYEAWAGVHELACQQFGEEDGDVWINHILFFLHFNKSDNVNEKVQSIYIQAERTLSPLLQPDFKEKYAKILAEQ